MVEDLEGGAEFGVALPPNGAYEIAAGTVCVYNGRVGPPSYLVRDLGKPRVPHLDAPDKHMLEAIMRYVHPSTLRFAYRRSFCGV